MESLKLGENVNMLGTRRSDGPVLLEVEDLWAFFEYMLLFFCELFSDYGIELEGILGDTGVLNPRSFNLSITTSKVKRCHTE